MGVFSGPDVSESGLVLALDAGNSKGFDDDENLISHSASTSGIVLGVIGSGGSLPTGWGIDQGQAGTTLEVVGYGVEEGLNYIDLKFSGTTSATNRWLVRPGNGLTLTSGVTYNSSLYAKTISGTPTDVRQFSVFGGAFGASLSGINSTLTRYSGSATFGATGTYYPRLDIGYNSISTVMNFTIRVAGFQAEVGSSASPYYPTTSTAKNRGSTLIDMTGRGNTGTLTNGPTYNSSNGGSIVFDGVDDFVINSSTTNIPTGSSSRTIQLWVYPKADTNTFVQLGTGGGGNQVYIVQFYNIGGTRYLFTDGVNGANNLTISGSQLPTLNVWNHIIFGNSGQNWFYYLNGVSQASGTFSVTLNTIGQKYIVGKRDDSPANTMNANIAQVSIYNRALTAAEIQQNFNATRSRYGI